MLSLLAGITFLVLLLVNIAFWGEVQRQRRAQVMLSIRLEAVETRVFLSRLPLPGVQRGEYAPVPVQRQR